jgi:hypothetical protein
MWLPLAASALKVCNLSMAPLQTILCAAYPTPTDRARGWGTEGDATKPNSANLVAPLLNQDAVLSLLVTSSLSSAHLVSLISQSLVWGGHSVGKPLVICEHDSVWELSALQTDGTRALRCQQHSQYVQ